MTSVKIRGIRSHTIRGRIYRYHRRTRTRIDIDLEAYPEQFLARVRELDEIANRIPKPEVQKRRGEELGDMFDAWIKSEEWAELKPESRYSYQRVISPGTGSLAKVRARRRSEFSTTFIVDLRDAIKRKHKRWLANYTVQVLRVAFSWGRLHGWCDSNPAKGVPLILRPVDAPKRNRRWTPEEFTAVSENASPELRRAIYMAYYAGMRVSDVVSVTWSAWDGQLLSWQQSKTGHPVHIRPPIPLREELNSGDRSGSRILLTRKGQPYTRDGLQTLLWKLVKRLVEKKLVDPGLCFHGLRHSLGAALYDLGLDRDARKAALGHTSDAASAVYERDGDRRAASDRAFRALDRHLLAKANLPRTDEKQPSVKHVVNNVVNMVPRRDKRPISR